jgi:hypothetical protein
VFRQVDHVIPINFNYSAMNLLPICVILFATLSAFGQDDESFSRIHRDRFIKFKKLSGERTQKGRYYYYLGSKKKEYNNKYYFEFGFSPDREKDLLVRLSDDDLYVTTKDIASSDPIKPETLLFKLHSDTSRWTVESKYLNGRLGPFGNTFFELDTIINTSSLGEPIYLFAMNEQINTSAAHVYSFIAVTRGHGIIAVQFEIERYHSWKGHPFLRKKRHRDIMEILESYNTQTLPARSEIR